jgi:hypothetical protein
VAHVGEADAPAHRGLCTIVFSRVPLALFGNRIPSVSAEIAVSATSGPALRAHAALPGGSPATGYANDDGAVDWDRKLAFRRATVAGESGIAAVDLVAGAEVRVADIATLTEGLDLAAFDVLPGTASVNRVGGSAEGGAVFWQLTGNPGAPLIRADPVTLRPTGSFGRRSSTGLDATHVFQASTNLRVFTVPSAHGARTFVASVGVVEDVRIIDGDTMGYVFGARYWQDPDTFGLVEIGHRFAFRWVGGSAAETRIVVGKAALVPGPGGVAVGARAVWFLNLPSATPTAADRAIDAWRLTVGEGAFAAVGPGGVLAEGGLGRALAGSLSAAEVDPAWDWMDLRLAEHDRTDDTLILVLQQAQPPAAPGPGLRVVKWDPAGGIVWNVPGVVLPNGEGSFGLSRLEGQHYGYGGTTPGLWHVLDTRDGSTAFLGTVAGAGQAALQARDSRSASAACHADNGDAPTEHQRIFFFRAQGEGAPLAEVVRDLCRATGLEDGDVDADALTGTVRGFATGVQSARADLQQLATAFQFDGVEADDKIVFRHRGGAPVTTLAYEELVRTEEASRPALPERREPQLELPRRATVHFLDLGKDQQANAAQWARAAAAPVALTEANGESAVDRSQLALTFDEAKTIARRWLYDAYAGRTTFGPVRLLPRPE